MSIYKDLKAMTELALHQAKEHNCNYNIIISNAVNGKFDFFASTYEMVADSYFNRERPNCILVHTTDELRKPQQTPSVTESQRTPLNINYVVFEPLSSYPIFDDHGSRFNKNKKQYIR